MYNNYITHDRVRIITKILKLLSGLYITLKNIDSKLDKVNEVTEVHIDESSGDVHINRKMLKRLYTLSKKFKSESESESESESNSDSESDSESTKSPLNLKTKMFYHIKRH